METECGDGSKRKAASRHQHDDSSVTMAAREWQRKDGIMRPPALGQQLDCRVGSRVRMASRG